MLQATAKAQKVRQNKAARATTNGSGKRQPAALTDEPVEFVYKSSDYAKFIFLVGNREINQAHLKRLRKSMKEVLLYTVLIVNEYLEIIDGQHRFLNLMELGEPVHYTVKAGYGLDEVKRLNAETQNWTAETYTNIYVSTGKKDYIELVQFREEFGWSFSSSLMLLTGFNHGSDILRVYKDGDFKIRDLDGSRKLAAKLSLLHPYFPHYTQRFFLSAILQLMQVPDFNLADFIHKVTLQPLALKRCASVGQYKEMIENIFNYRRKEKINLRFANPAAGD